MIHPSQADKSCLVAGHICIDVIPSMSTNHDFSSTFKPGCLLETGPVVMATGGAVSNTGQSLHKLGIKTHLMGKIGQDVFGQAILDNIKSLSETLVEGLLIIPREATSYTIILSPPHTDRIFLHCPGLNESFGVADIDDEVLQQHDLFHFGYPPLMKRLYQDEGAELVALFKKAKTSGITTSLDMSMPDPHSPAGQANWLKILQNTLPYIDLFVPSIEEILLMLYPDTFAKFKAGSLQISPMLLADVAENLLTMGAKVVLLKAGSQGLYLKTAAEDCLVELGRAKPTPLKQWGNREFWIPIFQTTVVGTTGAGDATIAGFLAALLRDLPPTKAITIAAAVGACNVESLDALSSIRTWEQTLARIEAGWSQLNVVQDMPGWHFDPDCQLWLGPDDTSV